MKKNLLALSIAAMVGGLSGVANAAVAVDTTGGGRLISNAVQFGNLAVPAAAVAANFLTPTSTGIGHILFVPYFSTQGANMTLLNLVNTDQVNGKAVKLRFRGAANSDDLFDISIFLSPGDVWAANVSANGDVSALSTLDTSCTLPSAKDIQESFGKFSVNRVLNGAAEQTREGYVEILNMADITPGSALFTATKHVAGKAPCTQSVMDQQAQPLTAGGPNDPVARGYSWPTGGLTANWTIVNTGTKASFSGEAVALRATPTLTIDQPGAANLVFSPQNGEAVSGAAVQALTADPLLKTGVVRAANYDFPDLSTPYTTPAIVGGGAPETQANALAAVLATYSISNEFATDAIATFSTDWVFSMPTRRYAVALNYANGTIVGHGTDGYVATYAGGVASNYFSADQRLGNASLNKDKNRICIDANTLKAFDREEQSKTTFVISPGDTLKFCGETSVLSFNSKPSLLGATIAAQNIPTSFVDGWMRINTTGLGLGLPVMGYAVSKAVGPDGGNFGGTWMHRTQRVAN